MPIQAQPDSSSIVPKPGYKAGDCVMVVNGDGFKISGIYRIKSYKKTSFSAQLYNQEKKDWDKAKKFDLEKIKDSVNPYQVSQKIDCNEIQSIITQFN